MTAIEIGFGGGAMILCAAYTYVAFSSTTVRFDKMARVVLIGSIFGSVWFAARLMGWQ